MVVAEYVPVYDFKLGNRPHKSATVWQVQSYLISSEWESSQMWHCTRTYYAVCVLVGGEGGGGEL